MIHRGTPLERLMPERIRNRRKRLDLTGAELARRAHVSAAYVSQIETGKRVPDAKVAVLFARVLQDDEALYTAWSRDFKASDPGGGRPGGGSAAWATLYREDRFEDAADFSRAIRSGDDLPPPRGRRVDVRATAPLRVAGGRLFDSLEESAGAVERLLESELATAASQRRSLVFAPVLEPGADPGEEDEVPNALCVDRMVLDPRLLPAGPLGRPFVFKADAEVARRVPDRVEPSDLVILSRDLDAGGLRAEQVYALRAGGRVFLGRLAKVGDRWLVLPAPGETEMEDVGLVAGGSPKPRVAGEVVAVLKVR